MFAVHQPHQPAMFQPSNPEMTIRAAVASGFGSSLTLFRGLQSISTHIFTPAGLPQQSPAQQQSLCFRSPAANNTTMGICASKDERRGSSHDPYSSSEKLNHTRPHGQVPVASKSDSHNYEPRPKSSHSYQQQSYYQQDPKHPEFRLKLICTTCRRRGKHDFEACSRSKDLNGNRETRAWRAPSSRRRQTYYPDLKTWELEVDLCGFTPKADTAMQVLQTWMEYIGFNNSGSPGGRKKRKDTQKVDSTGMGKGCGPFCAEGLLADLESHGVNIVRCQFAGEQPSHLGAPPMAGAPRR